MNTALKTNRPAPASAVRNAEPDRRGLVQGWLRFWFAPVDAIGLHCLRAMAGLLVICWMLAFAGRQEEFFSLKGWFDLEGYGQVARTPAELSEEGLPPATWSILYLVK